MFGLQLAKFGTRLIGLQELNPAASSTKHLGPKGQEVCSRSKGQNQRNVLPNGNLSEVLHLKLWSAVTHQTRLIDLDHSESHLNLGAHPSSAQYPESVSKKEATCKFWHMIFLRLFDPLN